MRKILILAASALALVFGIGVAAPSAMAAEPNDYVNNLYNYRLGQQSEGLIYHVKTPMTCYGHAGASASVLAWSDVGTGQKHWQFVIYENLDDQYPVTGQHIAGYPREDAFDRLDWLVGGTWATQRWSDPADDEPVVVMWPDDNPEVGLFYDIPNNPTQNKQYFMARWNTFWGGFPAGSVRCQLWN